METHDRRTRRRRIVATAAAGAALVGPMLTPSVTSATATPAPARGGVSTAVSAASPVLSLPSGPVPQGVPYGIGKRLYLNGQARDFAPVWGSLTLRHPETKPEFGDLAITRGVVIWAIDYMAVDPAANFGAYRPGHTPTRLGGAENYPGLATTTGGLVATGRQSTHAGPAQIYTTAGTVYAPTYEGKYSLPSTINFQGVGGMFVFQDYEQQRAESYRYYPGYAPVRIPDNTFGVGNGWVATKDGTDCYRTAPLMSPTALRARICSQVLPMLSDDGTKAVVVQGRHVRLYDTRTGVQINATNAPTLQRWDFSVKYGTHAYDLVQWLDASTYLVNVKDGTALALLRCSATTRACERAVTSNVRSGVTHIVS